MKVSSGAIPTAHVELALPHVELGVAKPGEGRSDQDLPHAERNITPPARIKMQGHARTGTERERERHRERHRDRDRYREIQIQRERERQRD